MSKELVVAATPYETRVAILEEGQLCEIYIEREKEFALVGSIYKGRVTRVLPGMQSAFVDIGLDSDAFLYVSDFLENLDEYDHIVTTVEGKVEKMELQGGRVFAPTAGATAVEPPEVMAAPGAEAAKPADAELAPPAPAQPAPPQSHGHRFEPRDRGYGHDRGGRGRWGRRGRDRRYGRELPPSKFATGRPLPPRSYEESEPILLPGESLAKYKDRLSTPPPAPQAQPPTEEQIAPPVAGPPTPPQQARETESGPALPESLYASPRVAPAPAEREPLPKAFAPEGACGASEPAATESAPEVFAELTAEAAEHAPPTKESPPSEVVAEFDLSEDQVSTLAEQLAEAKHEEAQAEVEESEIGEEEGTTEAELLTEPEATPEVLEEPDAFAAAVQSPPGDAVEVEAEPAPAEPPPVAEPPQLSARIQDESRARFQRPARRSGRHHGARFPRRHERHTTPRRPQLISEMLKPNQEIIVQIAKEPLGKKGARITSHVALPGRYLVYMPTVDHIGVSRKIASAEARSRLRRIVADAKTNYPGGFIVRTAAEAASEEEIRTDVDFLGKTWSDIRARAEQRKAPALLHRDLNLVERILRDYLSSDYTAIWVDSEEEYGKVLDFVSRFQPQLVNRVKLYSKETPIFEEFGIQQELDKALRPKVWLKSGGYIVINHTEALVAIDVNTGKFVGRGSTRLEDTIVRTNLEAVKEIVRQIRLRDLGGIIVVDFIDMEERRNREKVMAALDEALRSDRAPSKVLAFNEFGLVAITRKRTKQALERVLCQPCPYCTGSGMVKSIPTICYEIQAEARKMAADLDAQSLTLRVHPEIAKALKTRESALIEELEQATRKSVIIQSDPTLHWEQYDIF